MTKCLGIIAGGGQLPVILAQTASANRDVFVIRLSGFADVSLDAYGGVTQNIGEIGGTIEALRAARCETIVFAGAVRRPDFTKLQLDEAGQKYLPTLLTAARQGDDGLLTALVEVFSGEGFEVVGAQAICETLLCPVGLIAGDEPDQETVGDLAKAMRMARLIGAEDVGQGAVVADGLVLALEAQEGTDGMLTRLTDLPATVRGSVDRRRGVLVKCAKPDQERRIDLPVLGVETVLGAARAGLAGIGLEAGSCLIVDRAQVEAAAREAGIFVVGLESDPSAEPR